MKTGECDWCGRTTHICYDCGNCDEHCRCDDEEDE